MVIHAKSALAAQEHPFILLLPLKLIKYAYLWPLLTWGNRCLNHRHYASTVKKCQMPHPLASHVYIFQWWEASDNGRKPPGCRAVRQSCQSLPAARVWTCHIALLASTSRVHFAYLNVSHFSCYRYRRRAMGCSQESARVSKVVGSAGRTPSLHCHFHVRITCSNLTLVKFRTVKFSQFLFWLHTKCTKFAPFEKFPLYIACCP